MRLSFAAALAALALAGCGPESTGSTQSLARQGVAVGAPAGGLFSAPLTGPTPARASGFAIDQGGAKTMVEMGDAAAFDVRADKTAPGATPVAWLAAPKGTPAQEAELRKRLVAEFDGLRGTPIVIVGSGPEDRGAWNAAQRARMAGFSKVILRREGGL